MNLFFDTETTGLIDWKAPKDAAHQPRIVQLAAILATDDGKEIATMNCIVRPDGFEIPSVVSKIHGITNEIAHKEGVDLWEMLEMFVLFGGYSNKIIGHNIEYDMFVVESEFVKKGSRLPVFERQTFCTMKSATNIAKIPRAGGGYKYPKLTELYKHAFGKELIGAHNALVDVRATKDIYHWLNQQGEK